MAEKQGGREGQTCPGSGIYVSSPGTLGKRRACQSSPACGHKAHISRPYHLHCAGAVAVFDMAFQEICQCREADMRVLIHVHVIARSDLCRSHVVDKSEGAYLSLESKGQQAAYEEIAVDLTIMQK